MTATTRSRAHGDRVPPNDLAAERHVLGCALLDADLAQVIADIVSPADWYADAHRYLWEAIESIRADEQVADMVAIRGRLLEQGRLERVGGDDYLLELTNTIPSSANLEQHCERLVDLANVRRMLHALHSAAADGYALGSGAKAYLDDVEQRVTAACQDRASDAEAEPIGDVLATTVTDLENRSKRAGGMLGSTTGLAKLDRYTAGMCPGEMWVVAGRPGMGKSAFAQHMAVAAAKAGGRVLVFSLEMTTGNWAERMLAAEGSLDALAVRKGQLDAEEWRSLTVAANTLHGLSLHVSEKPAVNILQIRREARRQRRRMGGLDLVVIDYLQLMAPVAKSQSREQDVAEISRNIKLTAKELGCPVMALAQMNRESEKRKDRRPTLGDLRESGAIEQDADVILALYRDEVYNRESSWKNTAEVHVLKQRNGPPGVIRAAFFADKVQFADLLEQAPLHAV